MLKQRLLTGIWLVVLLLLPGYGLYQYMKADARLVEAKNGVIDLRGWNFAADGPVRLGGEWEFYRSRLLTPAQFGLFAPQEGPTPEPDAYPRIPGNWNRYLSEDGSPRSTGYATFRLLIRLQPGQEAIYGLETTNIRTANRIFVNGTEVGASGSPGTSAANNDADNTPYVGFAAVSGDTAEMIVQVSNYSYATGGIIYSIVFGDQQSIMKAREWNLFVDLMTIAGFAIPGLFFLVLFRLRRQDVWLRYLSLFCLWALVYVLTHGEKLLGAAFPGISFGVFLRIQLVSSLLVHYYLMRYVCAAADRAISRVMLISFQVLTVALLLIAGLPALVFSRLDSIYFAFAFLIVLYVVFALLKDMRHRSKDMLLVLASVQSIVVIIVVSILNVVGLLGNQILVPCELLVFVISQALLLARRFAESFREVEQLSQKLLTLDGLKDEFMANTSHELRTPLHGIVNMAESLLIGAGGPLNRKQENDLSMIVSTGKRLSLLINDILDFSKLKNGDIVLKRQPVDLRAVAASVLEVIGHMTGSKPIRLVQNWPERLPPLDTDENRLQQILFNLLGNAVKFTREGEIRIGAKVEGDRVAVFVEDTGIGIDRERLPSLFRAFDESGAAADADYSGTGLGLSITKKLVELNGGAIRVESEPGRGSVFSFTLPAAAVRESSAPAKTEETSGPAPASAIGAIEPVTRAAGEKTEYNVLAVDDDFVNLQVIYNLLSVDRCAVLTARSGDEALDFFSRGNQPDLVIVDWMMPGMSGLELCRKIRERYSLSELPVLMLTARSRPEDIQAGFRAGVNDFLGKPVEAGELRARARTLLSLRKSVQSVVRTEMAFLQAQIKPHFLYNSLNTIISLCPVDPAKTMELLGELSNYLRASFDFRNHDRFTSLEKELELVHSYLRLEKARFDERLDVEFAISGNMRSLIPPLSIQPIVENAVRHGIMRKAAGGKIRIRIAERGGRVSVSVADDGVGMTPERLEAVMAGQAGRSVGLRNIQRRLLTLYGRGMQVESEQLRGTTVSFEVPAAQPAAGEKGETYERDIDR